MDYRDQLIRLTEEVGRNIFKNARAMPKDKLAWKVTETGRTALDTIQEVAQCPTYVIPILEARSCPPFNPEDFGAMMASRSAWNTVDACEAVWNENLAKFINVIRAFPEEEMTREIDLPFVEGLRQSFADIMSYPYWNTAYHLGQICFIQTLYGDKEMR